MRKDDLEGISFEVFVGEIVMHQSDSVPVSGPRKYGTSTLILALIVGLVVGMVLGLIGGFLLGSVFVTSVIDVRTESYKVACSNNLRQIGIASQLYLNDYGTFPLASGKADQATDESSRPALSGFDHLQVIFDSNMLDNSAVVISPGSKDRPATRNSNGTFTLTDDSCSYLWTMKLLTNRSPSTAPLAACEKDCHPRGRHLLFIDGSVQWVTEEEFEKSFRKYFTGD